MDPGQHHDRSAAVDGLDSPRREIQTEIGVAVSNHRRQIEARPCRHSAIGKALGAQQLICNILRGEADAGFLTIRTVVVSRGPSLACTLRHPSNARGAGQ